jgi:DNA invertase Pin-like site-specific DNA recombinase
VNKARNVVEAENNLTRKMLEQNLGCSHEEIMQKLNISRPTYHRHINTIYKEDAKIWDKVNIDSAKYRAAKLIQSL